MSFTGQLPSWADRAPPVQVLCLAHSIGSGFLRRDDILIFGGLGILLVSDSKFESETSSMPSSPKSYADRVLE